MSEPSAQYSIDCSQVIYGKYRTITYAEPQRSLSIEVELATFFAGYDWIAGHESLARWTSPEGEVIETEQQRLIEKRIVQWGVRNSLRIAFQPALPEGYTEALFDRLGYVRAVGASGEMMWRPPRSLLKRIGKLLGLITGRSG